MVGYFTFKWMKYRWIYPEHVHATDVNQLVEALGVSHAIASLLVRRGYREPAVARKFINPSIDDLHSPFEFRDMDKAVNRILKAIEGNEPILIYGDYDADGVTAVALLYRIFKELGAKVICYIPHRLKEGYGLSDKGVEFALTHNVRLLITVDCGISAADQIKQLQDNGIDVIVTDHHLPPDELPPAYAIINPKLGYPYPYLSGCGVAWKLVDAIYHKLNRDRRTLYWYLDLVALSTVADVTPLTGENRIFTKFGLLVMERTRNVGIKALLDITGLKGHKLTPYHLGFILGPRINAQGRMKTAGDAVNLLVTQRETTAREIAERMEALNRERMKLQERIISEAEAEMLKLGMDKEKAIVIAKEGWHSGVIGIAASKLVDRYYRPVIFIALEDEIGKGSARSVPVFNLYEGLRQLREYFVTFGGHKLAAGFVIPRDAVGTFRESFLKLVDSELTWEDLKPEKFIDAIVELHEVDEKLVNDLEKIGPFGVENEEPLFLVTGVQVVGVPMEVGNGHLRFKVRAGNVVREAIAFNYSTLDVEIRTGSMVDLLFMPTIDEYYGKPEVTLVVEDIRNYGDIRS